jgi:ABC-type spermidine/putrescine transport system permease subunit II
MRRRLSTAIILIVVLAFLYLPILSVMRDSLNKDPTLTTWGGATLHWFTVMWDDGEFRSDIGTSALVAVLATAASVAVALLTVLGSARLSRGAQTAFSMLTYARLMLPEVVSAVGLFLLFKKLDIGLGLFPVVIGHTVFCSAYATVVIHARYAGVSARFAEAAADLGAGPWRTFRKVTVPLLAPAITVAALLSFTFSFDDVVCSTFLSGTSVETLPMLIIGMIRRGITPEVNAIAVTVMVVTLVTLVLLALAANVRSAAGLAPARGTTEPAAPNGATHG